jgi:hypothetical protein
MSINSMYKQKMSQVLDTTQLLSLIKDHGTVLPIMLGIHLHIPPEMGTNVKLLLTQLCKNLGSVVMGHDIIWTAQSIPPQQQPQQLVQQAVCAADGLLIAREMWVKKDVTTILSLDASLPEQSLLKHCIELGSSPLVSYVNLVSVMNDRNHIYKNECYSLMSAAAATAATAATATATATAATTAATLTPLSPKQIKTVAIHFPQFHVIPENDRLWGQGFTEWTFLRRAEHIHDLGKWSHALQTPHQDIGWYDLSQESDRAKQTELAHKYGVDMFMYYHFWFNGSKVMYKVPEWAAANQHPNIPFFLCWANEPWTKTWSGEEREVLIAQDYGTIKDWKLHWNYLNSLFRSPNYVKNSNRPIIAFYRPEHIGKSVFTKMVNNWRRWAKIDGWDDLYVLAASGGWDIPAWAREVIDGVYLFEPHNTMRQLRKQTVTEHTVKGSNSDRPGIDIVLTQKVSDIIIQRKRPPLGDRHQIETFLGVMTHWDNTPRHAHNPARISIYTPPDGIQFYRSLCAQHIKSLLSRNAQPEEDFIFISSWNEWNEGSVMEPSTEYGYMFLEAHKKYKEFVTDTIRVPTC